MLLLAVWVEWAAWVEWISKSKLFIMFEEKVGAKRPPFLLLCLHFIMKLLGLHAVRVQKDTFTLFCENGTEDGVKVTLDWSLVERRIEGLTRLGRNSVTIYPLKGEPVAITISLLKHLSELREIQKTLTYS